MRRCEHAVTRQLRTSKIIKKMIIKCIETSKNHHENNHKMYGNLENHQENDHKMYDHYRGHFVRFFFSQNYYPTSISTFYCLKVLSHNKTWIS